MLEDNYVFHKLYNKHSKSKLCESTASQQSIAVLKAGKEQEYIMTENHKLTSSFNCGGLWGIT